MSSISPRTSSAGYGPYRQRAAGGGAVCPGILRYIYLRSHFPRGKFQYLPACRGVLDDRTGDGVRRPDGGRGLAEDFFRYLCRHVLDSCGEDLEFFNQHIDKGLIDRIGTVAESSFAMMEYTEAVDRLKKATVSFEFPVEWGLDLQAEHERYLTEQVVGGPVFIVNYPKDIKAFYMRMNDDDRTVAAMDLLVPKVGEIIGGSQREERLDLLTARMEEVGIMPADLWWYLDTRRWGSCPHAGFGLGFERLIMYLTGMENIRDVIPFPGRRGTPNSRDSTFPQSLRYLGIPCAA